MEDWQEKKACRAEDFPLFFEANHSDHTSSTWGQPARALCSMCPVRRECLEFALSNEPAGQHGGKAWRYGIFGGLRARERTAYVKSGYSESYLDEIWTLDPPGLGTNPSPQEGG